MNKDIVLKNKVINKKMNKLSLKIAHIWIKKMNMVFKMKMIWNIKMIKIL